MHLDRFINLSQKLAGVISKGLYSLWRKVRKVRKALRPVLIFIFNHFNSSEDVFESKHTLPYL